MNRWLSLLILIVILLVAGAWLTWFLAYEVNTERPKRATVGNLSDQVEIGWQEGGYPVIKAASEHDAYTALGYVQAIERAWTILIWRQTALGRQAEWFGDKLLTLDEFARRLEFAYQAQEAYDSLSTEDKELLTAFADGVNAGLASRYVRLSDEMAMLGLEPEPWEPWHAIAIERLYAWLASPPPSDDTLQLAGIHAQTFFESDALLRDWLHTHGFNHSTAWTYADSATTYFFQQQVYGSSALPYFLEVVLQWPDQMLIGAVIPGTPFFQAGKTDDRAWAILPRGTAQLVQIVQDTSHVPPRYERLRSLDGSEQLITLYRQDNTLYFETPLGSNTSRPPMVPIVEAPQDSTEVTSPEPDAGAAQMSESPGTSPATPVLPDTASLTPDSTWVLIWSGFNAISDWGSWRRVHTGDAAPFRLLDVSGLAISRDGDWQVIGAPEVVASLEQGVLVGNTEWARFVAQDLDSLFASADASQNLAQLSTDYHSEWAATLAPKLVASVDSIPGRTALVNEALTYLRNWNYAYDPASIAAAIFDTWLVTYRQQTGRIPEAQPAETEYFEGLVRYQTLGRAVARLQHRFGNDLSQWRWENVYPDRRYFPVWSADTLISQNTGLFAESRFAPVDMPGRGHPTTVFWGPSPVQEQRLSPSSWSAWTSTNAWETLFVRRNRLDLQSPLGRYRTPDRIPAPMPLTASDEPHRTTVLSP